MHIYDPSKLLESLCSHSKETEWIEFKENNFHAEAIGKYVSAVANSAMLNNEERGYIVFGVKDQTHEIVGTKVTPDTEKVGTDTFLFWLTKQLTPRINVELCQFNYDNKKISMLIVDPGYQQPVKFQGRAYIRVDTSLQPLGNYPERERGIWAITNRFSFEEAIIAPNLSFHQIKELFSVETLLRGLGQSRISDDGAVDFLLREKLAQDNKQGGYDATNLLAISVAHDLRTWSLMERKGARVVTYRGKDKLNAADDVPGRKGYAIAFPAILAHIMERIPHREQLEHGIRRTIYEIPEEAIRELLANALIHQDFTTSGDGPLVEIYSDRIRFVNPGRPLIDTERFIDAPPRSRNVKLAHLMRRLGLCEERGSGIDRALTAIEKSILPPPLFQVVEDTTVVTVYRRRAFADMSKEERIRACYQHACLRIESGEHMSNASFRIRLGLPEKQYPQVSLVIRDALASGVIRPLDEEQANRNARYVPYWA